MENQLSNEWDEWDALASQLPNSGCDKLQVAAGTYVEGDFHVFTNTCYHDGDSCPRLAMKSGVGYELCNAYHAEERLIDFLRNNNMVSDGIVWIYGHYYACESCAKTMKDFGIEEFRVKLC